MKWQSKYEQLNYYLTKTKAKKNKQKALLESREDFLSKKSK